MLLFVQREKGEEKATMGKLYIDGEYFAHTMEPKYVNPGVKIMGQTATPAGQYFLMMRQSPNFGRILPMIMNVPNFSFVLLHALNRVHETQGCIGVGFQRGMDNDGPVIWESRKAEDEMVRRLLEAEKNQVLAITIRDAEAA